MEVNRLRKLVEPPEAHMRKRRGETTGQAMSGMMDGNNPGKRNPALSFPRDLSSHFMAFMFHRFYYSNTQIMEHSKLIQTIVLPIPSNLVETTQSNYNTTELGAVGGELSDLLARGDLGEIQGKASKLWEGIKGGFSAITNDPKNAGMDMLNNMGDPGNPLNAITLGFRTGEGAVAAGLNRYFGAAPNPHITALFRGVGLRTHNFTWKLSPQDEKETNTLSAIVRALRASMLPERGLMNLTLKYPDEVDIYIGGTNLGHMYQFKRAVIRNMSVNHAPDGVPSFFEKTGAPTALQINLDLLETAIHTREDYDEEAMARLEENSDQRYTADDAVRKMASTIKREETGAETAQKQQSILNSLWHWKNKD